MKVKKVRKQKQVIKTAPVESVDNSMLGTLKRSIPKGTFSTVGGVLGSYFGPTGSTVGAAAGDLVSKITGFGTYNVSKNSILEGNAVSTFVTTGDGCEICHREYLQDISGTTGFSITSQPINPCNPVLFPWLSQIALLFDTYELLGLVFEYRPASGSYAGVNNSAALGIVGLSTQYNVFDAVFVNKQQAESYEFSTSTVPFQPTMHPIECDPKTKRMQNMLTWQTLNGPQNAPTLGYSVSNLPDLAEYNYGNFSYFTQGMASAYVVGELWITYHVKFRKPRLNTNIGGASAVHMVGTPAHTATNGSPFGTSGIVQRTSNSSIVASNTAQAFVMATPGYYYMSGIWSTGNNNITGDAQWTFGANFTNGANIILENSTASNQVHSGANAQLAVYFIVTAAGTGAANTITWVGPPGGTGMSADVFIFPVTVLS